jgi:hypothetical protein
MRPSSLKWRTCGWSPAERTDWSGGGVQASSSHRHGRPPPGCCGSSCLSSSLSAQDRKREGGRCRWEFSDESALLVILVPTSVCWYVYKNSISVFSDFSLGLCGLKQFIQEFSDDYVLYSVILVPTSVCWYVYKKSTSVFSDFSLGLCGPKQFIQLTIHMLSMQCIWDIFLLPLISSVHLPEFFWLLGVV